MSFNNECPFCGELGYDLIGLKGHLPFCEEYQSVPNLQTFYQGFSPPATDAEIARKERDDAESRLREMDKEATAIRCELHTARNKLEALRKFRDEAEETLNEISGHYYTEQDAARCRELAKRTLESFPE